jgi:hypothetical protein
MPGNQFNALLVVLKRFLDHFKQRVSLILVDTHVVADGEDDFANFLFFAVLVVLFVLIEADGDIDACFSSPSLAEVSQYIVQESIYVA